MTLPPAKTTQSVCLGLFACLATGCWVPNATGETMQRDIRLLRADFDKAQKGSSAQQARLAKQIERGDEQTKSIAEKMQQLDRAARKTDAGFGVQLEELRREIQEQRGQNELLTYQVSQLQKKLEEQTGRVDKLETSMPAEVAAKPVAATPAPAQVPKDKKGMLAMGKKLAAAGKTAEARGVLRDLVRKFPKDGGVTDDAYFQLGESYFKEKNHRSALLEYIKVVEKFAKGKLVDDAYYRIGQCSMELGDLEGAQVFFKEVIENHKKSPLAKYAKSKLKEVSRRLDKEKKRRK